MSCIAILMSTFNGEKYLSGQLDSILNQSYVDWELFIRDDFSTDSTVSIIQYYAALHSNIHFISDTQKRGAKDSFIWLFTNIESDCYMFCDQDDIWLPHKIDCTYKVYMSTISKYPNIPIVIHSDLKVVDSSLNEISDSFWHYTHIGRIVGEEKYIKYCSMVTGCTMLFNHKARECARYSCDAALMHDSWITITTCVNGGIVVPIQEQLILYRQHGNNVLGAKEYRMTTRRVFMYWNTIWNANTAWFRMINSITHISLLNYIYYKFLLFLKK